MTIASVADALFFPMTAIGIMAFVMLLFVVVPQASVDLAKEANSQTSQIEVHSMVSTLYHGSSYTDEDETPISDYQTISYLICGKNPDAGGWLSIGDDQESIDTGDVELAAFYEVEVETPDLCGDNKWAAPEGGQGTDTDETIRRVYNKPIPVQGGEVANIRVVYSFE